MEDRSRYYLWEKGKAPDFDESHGQEEPSLTYYSGGKEKRGCVIVCAGGAYEAKAPHEGKAVAEAISSLGIHAFDFDYRVAPYHYPVMEYDILRAIRYVRHNAEEFNVDPEKVAVIGFSAGGHLATVALSAFDYGKTYGDEIDRESSRPNAVIFSYGVISLGEYTHEITRGHFLDGNDNKEELIRKFSGELAVKKDTPPCFIWHTEDDSCVPVENSLQLYSALQKQKIPSELHIFPSGYHGLGLAKGYKNVWQWPALLENWLKELEF